jgi:hypothetical protein
MGLLAYDQVTGEHLECKCKTAEVKKYAMRQCKIGKYICSLIMGIYDGYEWYHVFAIAGDNVPFSGGFDDIGHAKKYYEWMRRAVKIYQETEVV